MYIKHHFMYNYMYITLCTCSTVPSHSVVGGSQPNGELIDVMYILWAVETNINTVGSVLLPSGGEGGEDGCFLELTEDTTVAGFTIFYPNQLVDEVPHPYPWSVVLLERLHDVIM